MISGLAPIIAFIIGVVFCSISYKVSSTIIDLDKWMCTKFLDGNCVQYTLKTIDTRTDKIIKNS